MLHLVVCDRVAPFCQLVVAMSVMRQYWPLWS
jgi:hypothetical protein